MPTYDYQCQNCGHTMEAFQRISEDPLVTCPSCGEDALKRLISAGVGIIFKGSGFYVNDSKKSGSSASSNKKTEKTETKSSDSKSNENKTTKSDSAKKTDTTSAKAS